MPDLEVFEAEVKKNIKQLSSKDAKVRRKAAAWLGEAGDPTAITALVQVYKNDRDARVREAARYSLGMFRALQEAWDDDQERVGQLLEDVALNGKMGRRVPVRVRTLVKVELALLLAALLIVGAAFVLPLLLRPGIVPNPQPLTTTSSREAVMADLRAQWQQLTNDTETLRQEYQKALTGQPPDCNRSLTPVVSRLSAAERREYPEAAQIADRLDEAGQRFSEAKTAYDRACQQSAPLAASDVGPLLAQLGAVSQSLAEIEAQLSGTPATAAPTAAPASAEPAATPVNVRDHIQALQQIIDTMSGFRGANTLLIQYWTEVQTSGTTQGCRETAPVIPADYTLPSDVAQASPNLALAASLVNTGLRGVRDGWQVFAAACAGGSPGPSAASGLTRANAANEAFAQAAKLLTALRGGS
ncbi:MAG: HEAT repeat domain-containing protein [Chloroflexi bacterium]|nr:HEAT repeat domain-containing protein [Chloroflexota bacterium]